MQSDWKCQRIGMIKALITKDAAGRSNAPDQSQEYYAERTSLAKRGVANASDPNCGKGTKLVGGGRHCHHHVHE